MQWHSHSVPIQWSLKGVWSADAKITDITDAAVARDQAAVAVGDRRSVKFFRYPCVSKAAQVTWHHLVMAQQYKYASIYRVTCVSENY